MLHREKMSSSQSLQEKEAKSQHNAFLSMFSNVGCKAPRGSYFALYRPLKKWQDKFILASGIVLALAAGAPLPIIGVIFSRIINTFPPDANQIKQRIVELIIVAIAYFAVTWGWSVCWGITGERVSRGLREEMVDRALGLDRTYYETECPDITSRLTADAQVVQSGTSEKVGLFLQSVSYFIVAFAVGFWLNARLTGILFAGVIPSMTFVVYFGTRYVNRYSKQATECTTLASAVAEGAIRAVQVVQAFGAAETLNEEHAKHLNEALKAGIKKAAAGAMLLGGIFFVAFSANALAFWEGSRLSAGTSSGAGTIYAIVFLVLDASFVVGQFGPFIQTFALAATAGGRILDLIHYPPQPIDVYSESGIRAEKGTFKADISFEKVSFAYPARSSEPVLKSVSFKLKSGKTIGIVGSSGSGKSTIAGLLLRIYDPASGRILLGDHEIPEYNLASLRTQVALVDQDPAVFSGTVFSNIRQGIKSLGELSEEGARERCIAAAKDADAWSFIQNLPDGIDTRLGEPDGTKLSGGQKQRLCLARALVDNPSILILDEATSALDTISEASVLRSLSESQHRSNRTTVSIAHRLATVRDADDIIVMGHGNVLEQGSHSDLMAREDGAYRSLVEAQKLTDVDESKDAKNLIEAELDGREDRVGMTSDPLSGNIAAEASKPSEKQAALGHVIGRCLAITKDKWLLSAIALFACIVTGCLVIGESLIFGNLVSILNNPPADYSRINFFCLMFFILAIIALGAYVLAGTCFGIVSEYLIFRTRDKALRTILKQDAEWFLLPNHSTTALTAVLSMDSSHLSGLSGVILGTVCTGLASVVGGAILAHVVAWKIAIVLFATSPIIICAGFFRLSVIAKVEERNQKSYTQAAALATEACSAIRTVAALGAEKEIASRFKTAVRSQGKENFLPIVLGNLMLAVALAITYFVYALAYYWGSKLVREHEYTTLQFFIVLPAILFSAQASGQMFSLAPEVGRARQAAARVFALHDEQPTIDKSKILSNDEDSPSKSLGNNSNTTSSTTLVIPLPSPATNSPSTLTPQTQTPRNSSTSTSAAPIPSPSTSSPSLTSPPLKGTIEFRNVSLTYATRPTKPIFKNLSFTISAGQTVAFVGTSGAGKSSAINLIERFYDPSSGTILIDGIDVKSLPVAEHRARLSLVAQEPGLFAGSVAFNVGLGMRAVAGSDSEMQERVEEACKACGIHEFVIGLPDGYGTRCGINGSQLSGGQKQRIAIARACVRDPEVLLLDEATSALDSHSEQKVQTALTSASSKRTTIMIAHRLTTVQRADRIMVFDGGRVVGDGTHGELVRQKGGVYARMVGMQMLGQMNG